jgi:hypothetical protein
MYKEEKPVRETKSREKMCYEDPWTGQEIQVADPSFQGMQGVKVSVNGQGSLNK